jgi:hypothetical protein
MVAVGIALAIAIIAATFAFMAANRIEAKYLSGLILVGAVAGFIIANITSIKELSLNLAGIGEFNASMKTLKTQVAAIQENQTETAKVLAESQFLLSKSLGASTATSRFNFEPDERVNRLAEIAFPRPEDRERWLEEMRRKYRP